MGPRSLAVRNPPRQQGMESLQQCGELEMPRSKGWAILSNPHELLIRTEPFSSFPVCGLPRILAGRFGAREIILHVASAADSWLQSCFRPRLAAGQGATMSSEHCCQVPPLCDAASRDIASVLWLGGLHLYNRFPPVN